MRTRLLSLTVAVLACSSRLTGADLLPADRPIPQVIDLSIRAAIQRDGIIPADQADDATLIRRLTLDLVGRIPTVAEADAYVASHDPEKRAKLVDRLLTAPGFARFQALQFDAMLNAAADGRRGSVREYLQGALKDGKTWDAIFRDLMLPPTDVPTEKRDRRGNPAEFLKARMADADRLTNDISVAFFGVNVSCAQCHDHPHVDDWTQDRFYGMKSFLARTYDAGGQLAERGAGLVKFKPTRGPERPAKLMFLTGVTIESDTLREPTQAEQKAEREATEKAKTSKTPPPAPAFSARAKLVELALKPGQSGFFARSIVNRLWHRFFGTGLVTPLDQMHSENPATHPELLDWLARDTSAHGYDLRRLIRGIVMSEAYSRSSRYPLEDHPPAAYFAVARLKPLSPMQLATSLKIAATDPARFESLKSADDLDNMVEGIEGAARGLAQQLNEPTDDLQIGVAEALLFSNGDRVMKEYLTDGNGSVLGRAKAMKNPTEVVTLLVKAAYTRPPTATETTTLTEYIGRRTDRPAEAYRQVLWALVTSPEFRFSY